VRLIDAICRYEHFAQMPSPVVSREIVVNLIANTRTRAGSLVRAALDTNHYETAIKFSDGDLAKPKLAEQRFHGHWSHTIKPR
jgi:hypothetical protein